VDAARVVAPARCGLSTRVGRRGLIRRRSRWPLEVQAARGERLRCRALTLRSCCERNDQAR
jgi:hypothetical protein